MIERLWLAKIPFAWVVADTVYGGNEELRTWLEAHGYSFVLAVACDEPVEIQTPEGLKRMTVAEAEVSFCPEQEWHRLSMSQGTKGPRLFDWAVMPMLHWCADDGRHFLLIRRCVDDPSEKANGRGLGILRDEGVQVELADGEVADAARLLNQPFRKHARTGRPEWWSRPQRPRASRALSGA